MNSQTSLIISVVIALLILGGSVAFVQFKTAAPTADAPAVQAEQVIVDALMTSCTRKDQCIIVDTKCSFCCDYVAINSKSEAAYNQLFDKTCKNYSGTYCQCSDLTTYPSCVNGTCQMVKWSENKPIKTPPAPSPEASPAQQNVPLAAPGPVDLPQSNAFEEQPAAAQPINDDLFAPLPDDIPVPAQDDGVHVIQP